MTSLLFDTFPVDQLTLVVSRIPIWISPEFLNIHGRKLLIVNLDDWGQDQRVHLLNRDCPNITLDKKKIFYCEML
jgi:hypothetical protein